MLDILKSLAQEDNRPIFALGLIWQIRLWHKQILNHKIQKAKLNKK